MHALNATLYTLTLQNISERARVAFRVDPETLRYQSLRVSAAQPQISSFRSWSWLPAPDSQLIDATRLNPSNLALQSDVSRFLFTKQRTRSLDLTYRASQHLTWRCYLTPRDSNRHWVSFDPGYV